MKEQDVSEKLVTVADVARWDREVDVLTRMAKGMSNTEIAADLVVSDLVTLKPSLAYTRNLRVSNAGPPEPQPREVLPDAAVLGTNGVSVARGLTTPDQAEALVKRAMVQAARRVVVAADSSKAGDDHLHRFAALDEVDVVVTDTDLSDDVAAELRAAGPEVVTA